MGGPILKDLGSRGMAQTADDGPVRRLAPLLAPCGDKTRRPAEGLRGSGRAPATLNQTSDRKAFGDRETALDFGENIPVMS